MVRCVLCSLVVLLAGFHTAENAAAGPAGRLSLHWDKNILSITGETLPGGTVRIWYLEAYCRPGSTDRDWHETTIGHETKLVRAWPDGSRLWLRCELADGTFVVHDIQVVDDGVRFDLIAHNPTAIASLSHWAQPCIRVGDFTGADQQTYLGKSFLYIDDRRTFLPTPRWATAARYVPGQVWCPGNVNRNDVNPRPLSTDVPSNGLIGCVSHDERMILASVWEPWQELFQGIIVCLHSDFRIGGLKPGETKKIRGKLYLVENDEAALLARYARDFPEHFASPAPPPLPR